VTYCIDFFRKFKKEGNFCGLDKSEVSRLNVYLEIVEQLMKRKIPEEQIYQNFSVRAARPLIEAKDEARTEGMNFVASKLKEGKKVQTGDLQDTLKSWTCPTTKPAAKPVQEKKPEPAKAEKAAKPPEFPDRVPPAPCTVPYRADPAKPVQPSLGESVRKREMEQAGPNQQAEAPTWSIETCRSGKCPDGQNHVTRGSKEAGLGDKCNISGGFIRDQKFCPYLERVKRAAAQGFTPASVIEPAGKPLIEHPPYNVVPVKVTADQAGQWITAIVRGYLTPSSQRVWESIRKSGELGDSDLEIFQGLIDNAADRVQ
jgi:hypothetical protein